MACWNKTYSSKPYLRGEVVDSIIKNLLDGSIYTIEEVAKLAGVDVDYVLKIKEEDCYNDKEFVGDGSGVIYYMDIKYDTIVDGIGFRNTVYCAKCNMYCKGCHNKNSWNIRNGKPISVNNLARLLLENGNDITFSGGETSLQAKAFISLAKIIKEHNKTIWLYSGYRYEELLNNKSSKELLKYVDVLVDGKFVEDLKDVDLLFKGSSNQRLIDIHRTIECGKVVLWQEDD